MKKHDTYREYWTTSTINTYYGTPIFQYHGWFETEEEALDFAREAFKSGEEQVAVTHHLERVKVLNSVD